MVRRLTALVASLPLIGGGSLIAHDLAYRLVGGGGAYQHTHAYLTRAPTVLAILLGFSLAALAVALRHSELHLRAPAWVFALAPPVAFAAQEHLERAVQGQPTAGTALEPTFALGLVLQLPFALLAYVVARILFRAVAIVVRMFAARRPRLRPTPLARPVYRFSAPRPALARGFSSRGPPALSS
jgi:hypothetical protein